MSIQSFIESAKILYHDGHYDAALCLTCIAVDASSAKAYPNKKTSERYKLFLKEHFRTITDIGFPGISANGIRIKVNADVSNLKKDVDGYVDMEQIIYHVLRCGLVHDCSIESSITFSDRTVIGDWNTDKFYIPKAIIWGLMAAVNESN